MTLATSRAPASSPRSTPSGSDGGRLSVGEAPDDRAADAYLWIFAGRRVLEQPRVPTAVDRAAHALAGGRARFRDVAASDTRLYAAPVVVHGKRLGTVVAGVSLAPYEQTRKLALLASLVLGGLVLLARRCHRALAARRRRSGRSCE